MNVPDILVLACFIILMILGGFVLVYSLIRLTKKNAPSELSLPGVKIELKGPAWLVSAAVGAVMLASPVLAAAIQEPENVTTPPPSVQHVRTIPEPSYEAFRFVRDISILDLRSSFEAPWYTHLSGWLPIGEKPRVRPALLKNYMVVRKMSPANEIHLTYGTSGRLDVRCLTHQAELRRAEKTVNDRTTETWEVIADVSSVPVGQDFEIAVEATYWNAFRGESGDDYTTYAHEQTERGTLKKCVNEEKAA